MNKKTRALINSSSDIIHSSQSQYKIALTIGSGDHPISKCDGTVLVYSRNAPSVGAPVFSVTQKYDKMRDYYYLQSDCSNCEGNWCEHLDSFVGLRLDRVLFAARLEDRYSFTVPIYPNYNFGLTLDFEPSSENEQVVMMTLEVDGKDYIFEIGTADYTSSIVGLKALVEDSIFYIEEHDSFSMNVTCEMCSKPAKEFNSARDRWLIAALANCSGCIDAKKVFEDVVPEFPYEGTDSAILGNKIKLRSAWEGNTHATQASREQQTAQRRQARARQGAPVANQGDPRLVSGNRTTGRSDQETHELLRKMGL